MAYFDTKSGSLEEAIRQAVGGKIKKEKKLDPVGKEDGDIDNDGDQDSTDKYLAKRRKAIGKAIKSDKKENYDMGTPENTKSKLDATPGQSSDDWQQQVDTMQKKNASMREALAKMWGVDEGHNPFKKEEKTSKKEGKTMTGKPMTKVEVDPDMKEKKTDK